MKRLFLLLSAACPLIAQMPPAGVGEGKIAVQNGILAKVGEATISVLDVKKKMDFFFHQNYPHLVDSEEARFQFYLSSWRHVLNEMVDQQLMLADAEVREVTLTEGEVREEMESRFGPNISLSLDKVGLSYSEAAKMVKDEMIVRRMGWWFAHSKAIQSVTPQEIKKAYRLYLKEHPSYNQYTYKVLSVRSPEGEAAARLLADQLIAAEAKFPEAEALVKAFEHEHPSTSVQISPDYTSKDYEIADLYRSSVASLAPGTFSAPVTHKSRADGKTVHRIFYLFSKESFSSPSFEEMANHLKEELTQKALVHYTRLYQEKLRKQYGYDPKTIEESLPEHFVPFSLQSY
jgi:hypothetical protein